MFRVIFRKFKKGQDIIAFLPDVDSNPGFVMSYQHIGQHGEASYHGLIPDTVPATPEEFKSLLSELKSIYKDEDFKILKRYNRGK